MILLRKHWFDVGIVFSVFVILYIFRAEHLTTYEIICWLNLVALLFHQFEEYRFPGTFPGMVNKVMYKSNIPDRYPLNPNTSLYVNVFLGWTTYLLAALLGEKAIWLGIATIIISAGNVVAHTLLFNIKGKTFYNAGIVTSIALFVPCIYFFIDALLAIHTVTLTDFVAGIALGLVLNFLGVIKLIDWLADRNTFFVFEQRNLLPGDRLHPSQTS